MDRGVLCRHADLVRALPRAGRDPGQTARAPAVLLVSDLDDDDGDIERVSQVAIAYRRAGIPLHVVGLNASPEDAAFIRRFVTGNGSFTEAALPSTQGGVAVTGRSTSVAGLAVGLAIALAAFLLLSEPLRWRAA